MMMSNDTNTTGVLGGQRLLVGDGMTDATAQAFALPTGTVTFLLTDVEGSTRGWEASPSAMGTAIARQYTILDEAISAHGGVRPVEQGEGDSVVAAFSRASDAIAAALVAQRALHSEAWPEGAELRVRMAVHTGEAQLRNEGNYFGQTVIRTARLRAIGHGGQVLVSDATASLVADRLPGDATLVDLGTHRLKDLGRPERVWQLRHRDLASTFPALLSLDAFRHNLPGRLTPLVGRQQEVAAVAGELRSGRLVTLAGSGGVGKTRLALAVGAEVLDRYPGGVWWAELAPVHDASAIATTVLAATGGREDVQRSVEEQIALVLGDAPSLVILDNCEHVITTCADLVDSLLNANPNVTVLATSREPLSVPGEVVWRVPSLPSPTLALVDGEPITAAALTQYDAVRLFVDRARRARPNFTVTDDNAPAIAEVCHRLDGIALAIELAAARCRAISVERLASELDDRFRVLGGGARTVLPRQQTLLASVEWSYQLLDGDEQLVLRRLGVFAAQFDLDAAESVVERIGGMDRFAVLDVVTRLVDKSLVAIDDDGAEIRYRLLETIRQFAIARAHDAGELTLARDAHLAYFAEWAAALSHDQRTDEQNASVDERSRELRAALVWAVSTQNIAHGADLVEGLSRSWTYLGRYGDALELGVPMFEMIETADPLRAIAVASKLISPLTLSGHLDRAADLYRRYLPLARSNGDRKSEVFLRVVDGNGIPGIERTPRLVLAEMAQEAGLRRLHDFTVGIASNHLTVQGCEDEADALARRIDPTRLSAAQIAHRTSYDPAIMAMRRGEIAMSTRALLDHPMETEPHSRSTVVNLRSHLALLQADRDEATATLAEIEALARTGVMTGPASLTADRVRTQLVLGERADVAPFFDFVSGRSVLVPPWTFSTMAIAGLEQGRRWDRRMENPIPLAESPAGIMAVLLYDAAEAFIDGDVVRALELHHDTLAFAHERGWKLYEMTALEGIGGCAALLGHHLEGARLLAAAAAARAEHEFRYRFPFEQRMVHDATAVCREALGDDAFDAAHAEGAALSWDGAVDYAQRARGERGRPSHGWASLTPTEHRVVELVVQGKTNPQIAEELLMGRATVKTHLSHVFTKLGVASRAELASMATARG